MNISPILWILAAFWGINAEKFSVIQEHPTILAMVGEDVFIPCTFTANIQSKIWSYTWYKDGRNGIKVSNESVEYRGRINRPKEDNLQDVSIVIRDVRVNDSGIYYCKVYIMPLGEEYGAGTQLTVRGINAEKFSVIQEQPTILATVGEDVFISCTFTANIQSKIWSYTWYKDGRNGTKISNETEEYRGRIYKSILRDASIVIRDVRVNDSGVYYCKVYIMPLGEEYGAGTQLTVRGINAKKFSVIQEHPTILAKVGEDVSIPCIFIANIQSKIWSYAWYKDGRNGTKISNFTGEYRGRIYKEDILRDASIIIRDVRVNDSGIYYCKVYIMPLGEEYGARTQLTVEERKAEFQVIQNLLNIQTVEGQTVVIPCTHTALTSAEKVSFQWYKNARNGTEISNEAAEYKGRISMVGEKDGRNASIQIRDVKLNDSGLYYCCVKMEDHVPEYGAGTQLIVMEKTKPIAVLLLILLVSTVVELGVFLSVALYCLRLRRVREGSNDTSGSGVITFLSRSDLQKAQRQSTIIPENTCKDGDLKAEMRHDGVTSHADNITSPQLETEQDLDTNEEQSIYTPMESLKTFSNSTNNLTDSQTCPLISQAETTALDPIQYAMIKMDLLKKAPSLNAIMECNSSEHDYGYDELNITAKRDPLPEDTSVNQGNAADSEPSAAEIDGCENEDLETNVQC